jgi:hypothetical protein
MMSSSCSRTSTKVRLLCKSLSGISESNNTARCRLWARLQAPKTHHVENDQATQTT